MEINQFNNKDNHDFDVTIVVISCDKYKDLWTPFFHFFFKYWSDCPYPIYLASNEFAFSDPRVKSIRFGVDKDYSSNLLAIIKHIETPWLILWFEDAFITSTINTARISKLVARAQKENVGYLKLTVDSPLVFTKNKEQEFGPIPKGVKYRSALGMALYKKETLIKSLLPGESAWQLDHSQRSNSFTETFYALTSRQKSYPPIPIINAVIKGQWHYEAINILKDEGLSNYIPNRSIQSFWSYMYIKIYLFRLDIYRMLGKYWYD